MSCYVTEEVLRIPREDCKWPIGLVPLPHSEDIHSLPDGSGLPGAAPDGVTFCQIEYQHCVGRCRPTRHPAAPENGRNLKGLAICNSLSKVCKLAIVILYVAGFMVQTKVSELEQRQRWRHEWQMEVWLFQFAWGNTYNYPGCQRLFMRGFRFRSRLVAAGEKNFWLFLHI